MRVIEKGHVYAFDRDLDGVNQTITFVNREDNPHPGTQTQCVIRAMISRLIGNQIPMPVKLPSLDGEYYQTVTFPHHQSIISTIEALIDRTNHCDECLPWKGNAEIIMELSKAQFRLRRSNMLAIWHLRRALLFHEYRAMEQKISKKGWRPELVKTAADGHFPLPD